MGKFLEYKLPKANSKEIENMNGSITIKEMTSVIKKLPRKENSGKHVFYWYILPNVCRRLNTDKLQILPKNKIEDTPLLILWPGYQNKKKDITRNENTDQCLLWIQT